MTRVSLALAVLTIALPPRVDPWQTNLDGRSFTVPRGATVEVRDIPGPVYVNAGDTQSVSIRVVRTATSGGGTLPLRADQRGDRLTIVGASGRPDDGRRIELHLTLPRTVRLSIQRVRGELRVDGGIEGALEAADVAGAIRATVKGIEPVRIADVSGSVRLRVDADRGRRNIEIDRGAGAIAIIKR